jgi:hypothetical protein
MIDRHFRKRSLPRDQPSGGSVKTFLLNRLSSRSVKTHIARKGSGQRPAPLLQEPGQVAGINHLLQTPRVRVSLATVPNSDCPRPHFRQAELQGRLSRLFLYCRIALFGSSPTGRLVENDHRDLFEILKTSAFVGRLLPACVHGVRQQIGCSSSIRSQTASLCPFADP